MPDQPLDVRDPDGLGRWVREWRHINRWTQEQLAEALGYDVSYVAKIEQGRRPASSQFVARMADVAGKSPEELLLRSRRPTVHVRLPVPSLPVIGRASDVGELTSLLEHPRALVTLVGAPGIGKTTLAIEVAWQLAHDLRDGASFVPLAEASDTTSVGSVILHALGLVEQRGRRPEDVLAETLRGRELLLVLDNFEHVLGARFLVETLVGEASHLRVLVTSREPLGLDAERVFVVSPLAFPDEDTDLASEAEEYAAVKLFVTRSRLARPGFDLSAANVADVVAICARLAGLPLAISLAASASRILTPADIAQTLSERLEVPTDAAPESNPHRDLNSALDWSWALLEPDQQAVLARFSVFAGGATLAAARAVCSDQREDVLAALSALASKSLLAVRDDGDTTRFTCLEPVRVYAWERLRESGRLEEFRASHLTFFVELAEVAEAGLTGGEDQGRVRRQLDEDHANFATAFEWALEHQPEQALRLGAALWRFYSLSRIDEGRRLLTAALRRSQSPSRAGARCLNGLGTLLRLQGALDDAECAFGRAKRLAHALGLKEELGFSLLSDGIVAVERASYDTAEARFNEAMAVAEEAGDLRGFAHALNCLGVVALRRDFKRDATAFFLTALGRFRALNDQWSIAVTTSNLAWISETDGELAEAQDWYEESRQIWEAVGDEQGIAMATADLGRVARRLHDMPRARALLEQALDRFTRLGNRRLATACLVELADIAADRGRADLAARMLGAAAALREDMGTPAWPEERTLEDEVLARARDRLGTGATQRGLNIGRSLSLENAVEMVEADAWPPPTRRRRAR